MADIADLERRVSRLEAAQNDNTGTLKWIAEQVGKSAGEIAAIKDDMKALRQDVGAMDRRLTGDIAGLRKEVRDFQTGLPPMIGDVVREVLREQKP